MEKVTPQNPPLIWPITGDNAPIGSYKVYTALLSQLTGAAPTAKVLNNTIGAIIWTRLADGAYRGTLTDSLPYDKTACWIALNKAANVIFTVNAGNHNDYISVTSSEDGSQVDSLLDETPIEIRVYN